MKQHWVSNASRPSRGSVADHETTQRAASSAPAAEALFGSTRLLAQRRMVQASFGAQALQRSAVEDEPAPMQGQGLALQMAGMDEEELLQGKGLSLQAAGLEEEELLQGKDLPLQMTPEEEELLQAQGLNLQRQGLEEEEPLQGKGLPPALAAGVEQLSGTDVSDVRVHHASARPAQVGALAYAQGSDIHLAAGQEQHLPHEAWHVVQQRQGRVQATMQAAGVPVNDDPGLEAEADAMGARALDVGQRAAAQHREPL